MPARDVNENLKDIQANIVCDYGLPNACYLLYRFDNARDGRKWLTQISGGVTAGSYWLQPDAQKSAVTVNIAFTWKGLNALDISDASLNSFAPEFKAGMAGRSAALNDLGDDAPDKWQKELAPGGLHALIIVNANTSADLGAKIRELREISDAYPGVTEVHAEDGVVQTTGPHAFREHFGFADGIGQPTIEGMAVGNYPGRGTPRKGGGWDGVKPGEFIFGYEDESGSGVVANFPQPGELGINGTYLVFRKLHQKVFAFRSFLKETAKQLWNSDDPKYIELLAAKMVGRYRSGAPLELCPNGDDARLAIDPLKNNDFRYSSDPQGEIVPLGAHIRRVNPRDNLDSTDVLVKRHRLMRRGLPYGNPLPLESTADDGVDRGVIFIALNTSIERQFEFVQREWVNKGNTFNLDASERDPLVADNGGAGLFTIPGVVPPFIFNLQSFVSVRGGDYFFMPGITALNGIASGRFADAQATPFLAKLQALSPQDQPGQIRTWLGECPQDFFDELREHHPVLTVPGVAVATKYRDVIEILAHDDVFTVRVYTPRMERLMGAFFLGMQNTPQYEREVSIMRLACTRGDLARIAEIVNRACADCLASVKPTGRIEIVSQLTRVVPARLIQEYFGVPGPDLPTLQRWMKTLFWDIFLNLSDVPAVRDAADKSAAELKMYLKDLIATRRDELLHGKNAPDTVLTRMVRMSTDPETNLDDDGIIRNLSGLIIGALETTSQAVVQAVDQLLDRPELRVARASDDATLAKYVFEALRFRPQNPFLYRLCEKEYVLAKGTPRETVIPPGTFTIAATWSAMFDPEVVNAPDTFRLDRLADHYILFGYGLHACFGRYINLITIPVMAKTLLQLKNVRRADGPEGKMQLEGPFPNRLTLTFDPEPAPTNIVSFSAATEPALPVLITIPPSLGCEASRWILQHQNTAFKEEPHAVLAVNQVVAQSGGTEFPSLVVPGLKTLSTTNDIFSYSEELAKPEKKLQPTISTDPFDLNLAQQIIALGDSTACWAYFNLLPQREIMIPVFTRGIPDAEVPLVTDRYADMAGAMAQILKLTPENANAGLEHAWSVFGLVEQKLSDGRRYLSDDRFTLVDLLFAVQSAPFTFPDECGGAVPNFAQLPPQMQNVITTMRGSVAGRFALRIYREERNRA